MWITNFYTYLSNPIRVVLFFAHIPFVVNHTFNATPAERLQQYRSDVDGKQLHEKSLDCKMLFSSGVT